MFSTGFAATFERGSGRDTEQELKNLLFVQKKVSFKRL